MYVNNVVCKDSTNIFSGIFSCFTFSTIFLSYSRKTLFNISQTNNSRLSQHRHLFAQLWKHIKKAYKIIPFLCFRMKVIFAQCSKLQIMKSFRCMLFGWLYLLAYDHLNRKKNGGKGRQKGVAHNTLIEWTNRNSKSC